MNTVLILATVFAISGILAAIFGNKEKRMNQATENSPSTEKKDGDKKEKWHQRFWNKVRIKDEGTKGLKVVIVLLVLIPARWIWTEGIPKALGTGNEPIGQTMYPWEGKLTRDVKGSKVLNPPGEGYPISIEIKDAFVHLVDFDKLDLYIVGRMNDKDLPPQRYNPPRGFKPDLNVYQSYKVVLGSKSAYKRLHEGLIEIRMDTTRQWIGPQASSASIVSLD